MRKHKITEELERIAELIRKADSLISPITYHDKMKWLLTKDARLQLFEKNPKCIFPLKMGREVPFFPVCNRQGMVDPDIVSFSLKLAKRMVGKEAVDQEHLYAVIAKLEATRNKYAKDIPKPVDMAAKKGLVTKMMTKVKRYIEPLKK